MNGQRSTVNGNSADWVRAFAEDWRSVELAEPDRLLCELGEKLARDSLGIDDADIARLRAAGFDDRAIHDAVQVIAYFSYINRVADGLGVDAEEWLEE